FAEFEKEVHAIEESDGALTLETFKKVYRSLLEAYFGPRFAIDEQLDLESLRIPHFYSPFYVYNYGTAILAPLTLADRVMHGGTGELEAYLEFLKAGGRQFPIDTLRTAGVDMLSPEPIEKTMNLFRKRIVQLRELML